MPEKMLVCLLQGGKGGRGRYRELGSTPPSPERVLGDGGGLYRTAEIRKRALDRVGPLISANLQKTCKDKSERLLGGASPSPSRTGRSHTHKESQDVD